MLSFKKIEQSDINKLKKYYDYDECMGCDTNLLNAYLWRNEYNIKFAFYDDTIVKVYCNPDESVWGELNCCVCKWYNLVVKVRENQNFLCILLLWLERRNTYEKY